MTKRPLSAYNYFTKDQDLRNQIKTDHKDWSNSQIMSHIGELWRDITDEKKTHYVSIMFQQL